MKNKKNKKILLVNSVVNVKRKKILNKIIDQICEYNLYLFKINMNIR